jgi:hypothetical protein
VRDLLHRHGAADLVTATPAGLLATLLRPGDHASARAVQDARRT